MWNEIKKGAPQGSFINDVFMFFEKTEVYNFAADETIYDCGEDLSNIAKNLKHDLEILVK